jgi:hypothetical protein
MCRESTVCKEEEDTCSLRTVCKESTVLGSCPSVEYCVGILCWADGG